MTANPIYSKFSVWDEGDTVIFSAYDLSELKKKYQQSQVLIAKGDKIYVNKGQREVLNIHTLVLRDNVENQPDVEVVVKVK